MNAQLPITSDEEPMYQRVAALRNSGQSRKRICALLGITETQHANYSSYARSRGLLPMRRKKYIEAADLFNSGITDYDEIANRIGVTRDNVSKLIHRARAAGALEAKGLPEDDPRKLTRALQYRYGKTAGGKLPLGSMEQIIASAGKETAEWLFRQVPPQSTVAETIGAMLTDLHEQETGE